MPELNPRQRDAVRYVDGPLLVLAGAGSGKTRVITRKIAHLIDQCGRSPASIAAVTFTNKAAREMKQRVARLLKGRKARGLRVCTFHTLGLEIIRREHEVLGYRPGFSIFDNHDSVVLLTELMSREFGDPGGQAENVAQHISNWKSAFVTPEQALAQAGTDAQLNAAALMYAAYNRHLKACNAVDFDDLIMQPVLMLRDHAEVRERWQNRIRYLLVDEYQDTNGTQYELVKLLVGVRGALTVVGDDDQSIYAWRGARPENLARLREDYPQLKVIKLEQNYRSSGAILKAANALIANNAHVFEKSLWSTHGTGDPLRVLTCRDAEHEAERVAAGILHHHFHNRGRYRDFAVLYRGNHQARLFERALREHRIPYHISGGPSFFDYTEVRDVMAYLRLLVNPDDDNAYLRVVNTPRREIGTATLEKLASFAASRRESLFETSLSPDLADVLGSRPRTRLKEFAERLVHLGDRAGRGDPLAAVEDLIRDIDYAGWLSDTCRSPEEAERRMENVQDLLSWLARMAEQDTSDMTLDGMVARLTLTDIVDRNQEEDAGDAVHLMTLHAAKGLEFDHVFMVGMEEELLPHRTSLEEEMLEEERRLAYVGITRARKTLNLSHAAMRKRYGDEMTCEPSRFLSELPDDVVQWEGGQGECNDKTRGNAYLATLRGLLAEG